MTASLWLAAALACAQLNPPVESTPTNPEREVPKTAEEAPPPRPATSKIVAVTVYRGQALVTREVSVPEGKGTVELVVTPLPFRTIDDSLFAEGADGVRVLATRLQTRFVKEDAREDVRAKQEALAKLEDDADRLQKEAAAKGQDLEFLKKLEGFTSSALTGLTEKGRLASEEVVGLSKFVMETRGEKTKAEIDFQQKLKVIAQAIALRKRQLAETPLGMTRTVRDAVIVAQKTRAGAGVVRLGYLVGSADWKPQYRLRGAADNAPVRLEYLAAVVQQTGEDWPNVAVTLSTAQPSLDAAPPDLLPLKMADSAATDPGPSEANDERSRKIVAELAKPLDMRFPKETPLEDVLKYIKTATTGPAFPEGVPIYLDPIGLSEAEKTTTSPVSIDLAQVPLRTSLNLLLGQIGMAYQIRDGVLKITSQESADQPPDGYAVGRGDFMAGMAGMGRADSETAPEADPALGGAKLNQVAAGEQAEELRVADEPVKDSAPAPAEKGGPGVSFSIAGRLDVPSRRDPQLLEVARAELPAEYYAKAVPVLTPSVYRLAKLTNKADFVLLPGEATVYVGSDFVGRMRLPLVAAGEPFIAGFGVDPQLQVSRRLLQKSRAVQGGNQILTYEFRIGLRNYRPGPVKVQVWDRLPRPQGEAVAVNLVKTSTDLSTDGLYQRTARMDNLLRWDVDVPAGTVGDKTMYLNYDFRLEYARDLPQPRFDSGGLKEAPIGGGAMGGMGGGLRSVRPLGD
ncbi:mucoidy inhibitor MuiA family protein [Paludisphaera borealis]|uniref:DUF4139 domain-containing protein n=1 Tax=Paludisphaera borealis TaxID=1387353 RepID=A0A1U7CSV0_9BACT|nr:mucoidy inhibitor MuiA family protein [Paludisphaera borealis]APW62017.1 hypothetical protein BSF38_03549 [Paludisphaera borealis]